MRRLASSVALIVWALAWPLPASAQVRLSIDEGRVTLNATNATMSQILAEWARVGQTTIVNGDRVPGNVVAFELSDVSEADALEIILRSVSGYLLAPRPELVRNTSRYDRILILPTSSPVRTQAAPAAASPMTPLARPQFSPPPVREDDPSQAAPSDAAPSPPAARAPGFNVFPQAQQPTPTPPSSAPTSAPTSSLTVPSGVSVPGMVPAAPAQPAQPAGSSTTPRR